MPASDLHPTLIDEEVLELHQEAVDLFNAGRFFDSHEPWEEIWRSTNPEPRDLFQGLVQVAAGMYHWTVRGKAGPAARLLQRGVVRLESFRPQAISPVGSTFLSSRARCVALCATSRVEKPGGILRSDLRFLPPEKETR